MDNAFSFALAINPIVVLYFLFFVASLVIGVYVYAKNPASPTSRIFLLLTLAFAALHLGEIFFSWSDSKVDAFAFTAVKSIGFATWWPLSLHFFLTLKHRRLGVGWVALLAVLYSYCVLLILGFFLGINHAADYVRVGTIWIDKPYWSPLALPYLAMIPTCLSLTMATMVSLRRTAKRDKNLLLYRQVGVMLYSGLPLAFLGLFFNIFAPNFGITVPSIGHMFIGFWILVIGFAVAKYRFMVPTLEFASRQVFRIAGEVTLITDMKYRIMEFNTAFTTLLGYEDSGVLSLHSLIDDPDPQSVLNDGNATHEVVLKLKKKNGSAFYAKKKGAILFDNNLEIGIVFVLSDVSDLRNQNLLLESKVQERTRELVAAKDEAERRLQITEVYTRKSVVNLIQQGSDPREFQPVQRDLAILFADIRDFTGLSERFTPLETISLLNDYFDEMNDCVLRNAGEIDKLIGDEIMALFTDVENSVKTAIEIRIHLKSLNERLKLRHRLDNGVGINFGRIIAGNIGSRGKMDYTVIGDVVNTASRIESLTKQYRLPILISEETKNALQGSYALRFVDSVLVKGKTTPTDLYEVFDHEQDEVRQLKTANASRYLELFDLYRRGDFEGARTGFIQMRDAVGAHNYVPGLCRDPLLDFSIARCERLWGQQRAGVLADWRGIYEFMDK